MEVIIKDRILAEGLECIPIRPFKGKIGIMYIFTKVCIILEPKESL
jgi:hypothetical protein